MEDILIRIQELNIQLETIQRAERYRRELDKKLSTEQARLELLGKAMDKEHQDVIELEKWSLRELFVKVTDKEAQLEQEKEEYLQAAVAWQEAKKEVELISFEIGVLQEKAVLKKEIETELEALFERREADILRSAEDHPLKQVREKLARLQQVDRELEEALLHGAQVEVILEDIAQNLIRAKNWTHNNMHDYPYRFRVISEEIDQARLRLPKLRLEYVKFEQELQEVLQYPELESWPHDQWEGVRQIQQLVQELSHFTQGILQGLFRLIELPQQLHRTHTLADHLRHQTETAVKWLRLEQNKIKQRIGTLESEKRQLLS